MARRHLAPDPGRQLDRGPVPTFSVIIPAYQVAEYIGHAVTSALNQTLPAHEVIVCDDGSTDGIQHALAPFLDSIRLLRQENRGVAAAKNTAAAAATGDFVAVLDADDAYLPDRLAALGELAAARPDLDVLATDVYVEAEDRVVARFYDPAPFPVVDQRAEMLRRCFIWSGSAVRRKRLADIDGFDETIDCSDDWDCWLRLVLDGSKIGCVDEPLARYRLRPGAMTEDRSRDFAGRLEVLEHASARHDLAPEERRIVSSAITSLRPRLQLARAQGSIARSEPDARLLSLDIAKCGEFDWPTRIRAAAAALSPSLARAVTRRRRPVDTRVGVWLGASGGRGS